MRTSGYLILQHAAWTALRPAALAAALAGTPVRSVLLEDVATRPPQLKELVQALQGLDIAVLADDLATAVACGADGFHLAFVADPDNASALLVAARKQLGAGAIVGVEATGSRHNAMLLGEQGADYLAFGGPADQRQEFVTWWADLFEPPVVAWGLADAQDVRAAVEAGADFAAVTVSQVEDLPIAIASLQNVLTPARRS
jgi:thiamine-phosphate pyrophosphorylase